MKCKRFILYSICAQTYWEYVVSEFYDVDDSKEGLENKPSFLM